MSDCLEIIACEQGSPEWTQSRLGIPTASEFAAILTKGRGGAESKTRLSYLYKLAGERLTGEPMESISSFHMERGKLMEDEARSVYGFVTGRVCERVGFLRRGKAGASPDALIGQDGLLEIKTNQAAASDGRDHPAGRVPAGAQGAMPGPALDRRAGLDRHRRLLAGPADLHHPRRAR